MEPTERAGKWRARLAAARGRFRRSFVSDAVEVAGFGCLVAAAWEWQPIAGLSALGAVLILVGTVLD